MSRISRRSLIGVGLAVFSARAARTQTPALVVTGDLGVVGQRLVPLLAPQFSIIGIDKKRGTHEDLELPWEAWASRLVGARAVLHLAWDVPRYNTPEGAVYNNRITGAAFFAAQQAGVPRFVFASSAWAAPELYGGRAGRQIPAIYAESKRANEAWLERTGRQFGVETCSIRFGQVNPKREDQSLDPDFYAGVLMTDRDLLGLVDMALTRQGVLGPFEARHPGAQ